MVTPEQQQQLDEFFKQKGIQPGGAPTQAAINQRILEEGRALYQQRHNAISQGSAGQSLRNHPVELGDIEKDFGAAGNALTSGVSEDISGAILGNQAADTNKKLAESDTNYLSTVLQMRNDAKAKGEDTSHWDNLIRGYKPQGTNAKLEDLYPALGKSNEQVLGDFAGLAANIIGAGSVGAGAEAATAPAKGVLQGVKQGALAGAKQGAIAGAAQGFAGGLKDEQSAGGVALSTLEGGAAGGAIGGVAGGALGGITAEPKYTPEQKAQNKVLDYITPTPGDLSQAEYKELLSQGRITPKTLTEPAKYILSPNEKATALKYSDVITRDPVKTTIGISDKIGQLDDEVGQFLEKNNGIYNKGELRNALKASLEDVNDITVPEERIQKAKDTIINNFVDSLEKGDMKSLWEARKAYDQKIDSAFKGSPTLQKEIKTSLRNAVQDFISENTPDTVYADYMKDMRNLFHLRDISETKAARGKAMDEIADWIKKNPRTAKVLGFTVGALGLGALGTIGLNAAHAAGE